MKYLKMSPIFSIFSVLFIGCRDAPPLGSCTKSAMSGSLNLNSSQPGRLGGFIYYGEKRCTAQFEVEQNSAGQFSAHVWTARHCSSVLNSNLNDIKVSFFTDKSIDGGVLGAGYYAPIVAEDDFISRKQSALAEVEKLGVDSVKSDAFRRVISYSFDSLSVFDGKTIMGDCGRLNTITVDSEMKKTPDTAKSDTHSICASYSDIGYSKIIFPNQFMNESVAVLLKNSAVRTQNFDQMSARKSTGETLSQLSAWKQELKDYRRIKKLASMAYIVDWKYNCVNDIDMGLKIGTTTVNPDIFKFEPTSPPAGSFTTDQNSSFSLTNNNVLSDGITDNFNPSSACLKKSDAALHKKFVAILEKNIGEGEKNIFQLADVEYNRDNSESTYVKFQESQLQAKAESLKLKWKQIQPLILKDLTKISVGTNLQNGQLSAGQKSADAQYAVVPVTAFAKDAKQLIFSPSETSLEIEIPNASKQMEFTRGDSGSLFFLYDVYPVLALNSVDGGLSSGSASVLPLPQRKETSANNNQVDYKNTASADGKSKVVSSAPANTGCSSDN